MKYSLSTTLKHSIVKACPVCIDDFNSLIQVEGYNGAAIFTNNEQVINLDKVEREIALKERRLRNKSMDSAFGLKSITNSFESILFVEFKFNLNDFKYLRKIDMEEKVKGSFNLLKVEMPICNQYIFVFQTTLKQQAIRRLFLMNPVINSSYIVMDIIELKTTYF